MTSKTLQTWFQRLALGLLVPILGLDCGAVGMGVAVDMVGLPATASSVLANLTLDGRSLGQQQFSQSLTATSSQLAFALPVGTRGSFAIELLAEDAQNCVLARAFQTVQLADDVRYNVMAPFSAQLPAPQLTGISQRLLPNNATVDLKLTG